MLSGLQVSGSIDGALNQAHRETAVIDREVSHLSDRLLRLTEAQGAAYQDLARIRFGAVRSGHVLHELSGADRRARELIDRRQAELARLDEALAEINARLAEISRRTEAARQRVEECTQRAKTAEQVVREELERSADYLRQRAAAETAIETARFAAQKTELADKDRSVKGEPYQQDPLFVYLWKRRYGSADYRANTLTRMVDGWIAKLIGYSRAAGNYRMLLEIPKRLAEHAERLRGAVETETGRLHQLEEAALEKGDSGLVRKELRTARAELDACDEQLEAVEAESRKLSESKTTLERGEDETTQQALAAIESALRSAEFRELREQALGTPYKEDDAVVRRLEGIEAERRQVAAALENQKAIQLSHRRRQEELEQVRREYRRGGYADDSWDFRSGDMLSVLLGEMLRGSVSRDIFWESMRRHQRPSSGTFGGGGFQWPSSGGGGLSGSSDSFGGGGFRTGGGF